jgi:hypothetical protein
MPSRAAGVASNGRAAEHDRRRAASAHARNLLREGGEPSAGDQIDGDARDMIMVLVSGGWGVRLRLIQGHPTTRNGVQQ